MKESLYDMIRRNPPAGSADGQMSQCGTAPIGIWPFASGVGCGAAVASISEVGAGR